MNSAEECRAALQKLAGRLSELTPDERNQYFGNRTMSVTIPDLGVTYATKEELFATADIITVHVVLSQRSRGLVGAADLARMKPSSYLVNTARGPIVDEAALLQTLQQKKIAGAAVDVFSVEPLPTDHPFRKLDNIVLTPHLGYVTEEGFRSHYGQMVEGIDSWLKGEPLRRLA